MLKAEVTRVAQLGFPTTARRVMSHPLGPELEETGVSGRIRSGVGTSTVQAKVMRAGSDCWSWDPSLAHPEGVTELVPMAQKLGNLKARPVGLDPEIRWRRCG